MARNIIKIKYNANDAILEINGTAMSTSISAASLIESSVRTFATEWLMKVDDGVFISPTGDLRITIRSSDNDNEVEFVIEE
jgi:hypothetical protein